MSQAVAVDTSTWSTLGPRTGQSARNPVRDFTERGGRRVIASDSVMEFQRAPRAALGLTPPSVIKEREKKKNDFIKAVEAGSLLAIDMATADEIDLHDFEVWKSAVIKMIPYVGLISAPLVYPLQLGGVSFEWHVAGMNIEIRFRGEQDIFVVIEDARQEISEFYGRDPFLLKARQALDTLIRRQA